MELRRAATACLVAGLVALGGCGDDDPQMAAPGGSGGGGGSTAFCEALTGAAGASGAARHELLGAPLLFSPTAQAVGISVALEAGDPATLGARVRAETSATWSDFARPEVRAPDLAEWKLRGLEAGTRYQYEIVDCAAGADARLYLGGVVTARPPGDRFTFAMVSDTHIGADLAYPNQGNPATLSGASAQIGAAARTCFSI